MFFAVVLRIPDSQQKTTGFFIDLILSILAEILSTGILIEPGTFPLSYSCGVLTSIMTAPLLIASFILFFPNKPNMTSDLPDYAAVNFFLSPICWRHIA